MSMTGIIGAGAWGTSIASLCAENGHETLLWARESDVAASINGVGENTLYLPGVALPSNLKATSDINDMLKASLLFLVPPAQHLRTICGLLGELKRSIPLVICSKGIESSSLMLMSEVVDELLPGHDVGVLTGPTFADEVAQGLPVSMSIASGDDHVMDRTMKLLQNEVVSLFETHDVIGAQIGGAMKNVIAIASGIVEGAELGQNARAAVITKGLDEMREVSLAKGGMAETMRALCGVGDLLLTCGSDKSRNMSLGLAIGQGEDMEALMGNRKTVAEGFHSAVSVDKLAQKLHLKLPVCAAVYGLLHDGKSLDDTVKRLVAAI